MIAAALFRRSAWTAGLLLLLPVWVAREYGYALRSAKVLLAGGALAVCVLFGFVATKLRWSLKPLGTRAIYATSATF